MEVAESHPRHIHWVLTVFVHRLIDLSNSVLAECVPHVSFSDLHSLSSFEPRSRKHEAAVSIPEPKKCQSSRASLLTVLTPQMGAERKKTLHICVWPVCVCLLTPGFVFMPQLVLCRSLIVPGSSWKLHFHISPVPMVFLSMPPLAPRNDQALVLNLTFDPDSHISALTSLNKRLQGCSCPWIWDLQPSCRWAHIFQSNCFTPTSELRQSNKSNIDEKNYPLLTECRRTAEGLGLHF